MSFLRFYFLPQEMPPESRMVLLVLDHAAEPVLMRRYGLGSWRLVDDAVWWEVDGLGHDFPRWGWRLRAWAPLPPVAEVLIPVLGSSEGEA